MTYNAYAPYYYQQAPQQYYPNQPLPQASNTIAASTLPTLPGRSVNPGESIAPYGTCTCATTTAQTA